MATTTNYGWETPDDTDLVKDGAAAIRTLGSSVDTTTKALNPSTTLGDIEYRSATANTNARLGIGTTGQVLSVAAGVPAWSTPSSGSLTQIATGTLSGASVSITSIPQTFNSLSLRIQNAYTNTVDGRIHLKVNSLSSIYSPVLSATGSHDPVSDSAELGLLTNQDSNTYASFDIQDYTGSSKKLIQTAVLGRQGGGGFTYINNFAFGYNMISTTNAINEINILAIRSGFSPTFSGGTYTLYGVK